jgi:hypothetical protein
MVTWRGDGVYWILIVPDSMEASSKQRAGQEIFCFMQQNFPLNHNVLPLAFVPSRNLNQNSHLRPHITFVLYSFRCDTSQVTSNSTSLPPSCTNAPFPVIRETYQEVPSVSGRRHDEYEWTTNVKNWNARFWSGGWGYTASYPDICTVYPWICCLFPIPTIQQYYPWRHYIAR